MPEKMDYEAEFLPSALILESRVKILEMQEYNMMDTNFSSLQNYDYY